MSEQKKNLLEKLKALPIEDVLKYESAAVTAGRIINVIGIILCFLMLAFPGPLVFLICIPIVLLIGNMGAGIGHSLGEIRRHLLDPKRVDK